MNSRSEDQSCCQAELVCAYALRAIPSADLPSVEEHLACCACCRGELEALRPVVESFSFWPTDVVRPAPSLQARLARRVGAATATAAPVRRWDEPAWDEVGAGIYCKLLAIDTEHDRVSMLVRLSSGAEYPPHTHRGVEELHLLGGELWIDGRVLYPGDYNRAEPGSSDWRVWSETGCTCVLITSMSDLFG
jgi:quercetin dioxygenase-like cupin family protein